MGVIQKNTLNINLVSTQINDLKKILDKLIEDHDSNLTCNEILEISTQLDELINIYMKGK
ncbi:aspartyl-phosphate phosphatase Spo0E family protein [Clostridium tepidiprofundi]|uniref:aspartyl-phosphate phosphatase Spo0E family protein n=1 Tax=Clostridium tepidiprofundi TaxID=420412 RepID=UPI0009FB99BA